MRQINYIIIHCSATKEGRAYTVSDLDRWHRQRGWRCCGYHYVIGLDGTIWPGRPESEKGAHCQGHNYDSIGVCYIGGLDSHGRAADTRTPEQRQALHALVRDLLTSYPDALVRGHRDMPGAQKDCPCFDVSDIL